MMVLMVVMFIFICDEREDCLHQIKEVDRPNHYQHLVKIVWRSLVMTVVIMPVPCVNV